MSGHLGRARAALSLRRWDVALEALAAALADDPNDPEAHALRAHSLYRQGRYLEAQSAAREVIAAAPDWGAGYYWLGWSYLSNGLLERPEIQRARQAATEALRCDPDEPEYWALLAQVTLVEGNARQAAAHAQTGLRRDPDHQGCLEALAAAQKGSTACNQRILSRLLELNPESVFAHRHLATAALSADRPLDALEHARTAIQADPTDEWALDTYHEVVRNQHPVIRLLLWSSAPWQRYAWFPILGGIPFLLVPLIRGFPKDNQGDPWFWGVFCFFVLFAGYGLFTIVLSEVIASHSRRLKTLLPEAAATRRKFYATALIVTLFAASVSLAVWWGGPLPVITFIHSGTFAFLVYSLRRMPKRHEQIAVLALLTVPVMATIVSAAFDCRPSPVVWFVATIVATCLVWAAALKVTKSEYAS